MSTTEFWWEYDYKIRTGKKLREKTEGRDGFSGQAWADARKVHSEKMKYGRATRS